MIPEDNLNIKTLVPENLAIIKPIKATSNAVIRAGIALPS